MEGQTENSEEIDVIERRFVLRKHRCKKYVCNCGGCVQTAPGPVKLTAGGRCSIDIAIEVAISKYLDHLPLERQVRIMGREGLVIDSQTLRNQLDEPCVPLRGACARLLGHILGHEVIGADETTWKMLGGKQGSKTWRMWAVGCEDAVCSHDGGRRGVTDKATRDNDGEMAILTDHPKGTSSAVDVAELYRKRWKVETMFRRRSSRPARTASGRRSPSTCSTIAPSARTRARKRTAHTNAGDGGVRRRARFGSVLNHHDRDVA